MKRSWFEYAPGRRNDMQTWRRNVRSVFRGLRDEGNIRGLDMKDRDQGLGTRDQKDREKRNKGPRIE